MERVLLADDHPLFREALKAAIKRVNPELEVEEVDSLADAKRMLASTSFALVLLDLKLADCEGFFGLHSIRSESPHVPVVVVSANEDPEAISNAMAYGAAGFIPKSAGLAQLGEALETVFGGDLWTPPDVPLGPPSQPAAVVASLSPAQARVLAGVMKGQLNKQIAHDLGVTEATVRAHMTAVFRKLGVSNRTQAVLLAQSAALGGRTA